MGLLMKYFNIFRGSLKNLILSGGLVHKNPIYRGDCLKRRELGKFADLRGIGKKEGVVLLRGVVDTPMHTMN